MALINPFPDIAVCDPGLAVETAAAYRGAALSAILNPKVTGAGLELVANRAELTVANTDHIRPFLFKGRSTEDQIIIWKAMAARSEAAARKAFGYLTRSAAAVVRERAEEQQWKGARKALDGAFANEGGFLKDPRPDEPTWVAALANSNLGTRIQAAVFLAETPQELMDVAELLREVDRGRGHINTTLTQQYLAATVGHPEVVAHWAREGGWWGQVIAAGDIRIDADTLALLRESADNSVLGTLNQNVATRDCGQPHRDVTTLLRSGLDKFEGGEPAGDFLAWRNELTRALRQVDSFATPSESSFETIKSHCLNLGTVVAVHHLLETGAEVTKASAELTDLLVRACREMSRMPAGVRARVAAKFPTLPEGSVLTSNQHMSEYRAWPEFYLSQPAMTRDHTWADHMRGLGRVLVAHDGVVAANWGFEKLKNLEQVTALYMKGTGETLSERLREVEQLAPIAVDTSVGYAGVFTPCVLDLV